MSNLEDLISPISDFIKRYKCIAIIKFTLGKYTDFSGFEKHIFHEESFTKIESLLDKCSTWDDVSKTSFKKVKNEPEKIIDSIIIICNNGAYDILITAETKKQVDIYISDDFSCNIKTYKRKNHYFNISRQNSMLNGEYYTADIVTRIEKDYKDTYIAHSSLLKIEDLIKQFKDVPEEFIFTILQKNN